jgi:hypothetical protein
MTPHATKKADRIFVQNGRQLYRRRFSATETRLGIVVLVALASILGWVAWKGANPDPTLFALETDLSQPAAAVTADRGPVPMGLASDDWSERKLSQFDYDNLYVKINGREGYYKSFEDAQKAVDIELYDLGSAANAVGAYSGERSPDVTPQASESGLAHMERNALFLTRGRFYLRAIGSDESPEVRAQLEHLRSRFELELPAEPLPWGYALFAGRMGIEPGAVSFAPENAFSFGFARNVYSATLDDDAELFVTLAGSESDATELADRFRNGFLQYGTRESGLIKDRYLGTWAAVTATGPWVVGIRRAPSPEGALRAVENLSDVVAELPLPTETTEPPASQNVEEEYEADAYQ